MHNVHKRTVRHMDGRVVIHWFNSLLAKREDIRHLAKLKNGSAMAISNALDRSVLGNEIGIEG